MVPHLAASRCLLVVGPRQPAGRLCVGAASEPALLSVTDRKTSGFKECSCSPLSRFVVLWFPVVERALARACLHAYVRGCVFAAAPVLRQYLYIPHPLPVPTLVVPSLQESKAKEWAETLAGPEGLAVLMKVLKTYRQNGGDLADVQKLLSESC